MPHPPLRRKPLQPLVYNAKTLAAIIDKHLFQSISKKPQQACHMSYVCFVRAGVKAADGVSHLRWQAYPLPDTKRTVGIRSHITAQTSTNLLLWNHAVC
jgi:hypothetical protein